MEKHKMHEVDVEEASDIVEMVDDQGKKLSFHHLSTIQYKDGWFVLLKPAEKIEGTNDEDVFIYRIDGEEGEEVLLPIEDEVLLEEVFEEFCRVMEEDELSDEAAELDGCDCGCEDCDCEDDDCDCEDEDCDCGCGEKNCNCKNK